MRGIDYLVLRFGLFVFFTLVTSPVVWVSIWCVDYLDAHERVRMLRWAFIPILLAWLFLLPCLTSQIAQYMAFEDQRFGAAVRLTYYDLRVCLGFLPLVGHWFEPHTDQKDSDDDDP
jgi:hypothetical protein